MELSLQLNNSADLKRAEQKNASPGAKEQEKEGAELGFEAALGQELANPAVVVLSNEGVSKEQLSKSATEAVKSETAGQSQLAQGVQVAAKSAQGQAPSAAVIIAQVGAKSNQPATEGSQSSPETKSKSKSPQQNTKISSDTASTAASSPIFMDAVDPTRKLDLRPKLEAMSNIPPVGTQSASNVPPSALDLQLSKTGFDRFGIRSSFAPISEKNQMESLARMTNAEGVAALETPAEAILAAPRAPMKKFEGGDEFLKTLGQLKAETTNNSGISPTGLNKIEPQTSSSLISEEVSAKVLSREAVIPRSEQSSQFIETFVQAQPQAAPVRVASQPVLVTGEVTIGSMARERLSSDSVNHVRDGIRSLSLKGGGEVKIRLKPESLGEVHIKVNSNGKDVGLEIQASDENAKRILQESLSTLKGSLATHDLNLKSVDVSTLQPKHSSMQMDADPRSFDGRGAQTGFEYREGNENRNRGDSRDAESAPVISEVEVPRPMRVGAPGGALRTGTSRIDIRV